MGSCYTLDGIVSKEIRMRTNLNRLVKSRDGGWVDSFSARSIENLSRPRNNLVNQTSSIYMEMRTCYAVRGR